jgi:hypothetical protein
MSGKHAETLRMADALPALARPRDALPRRNAPTSPPSRSASNRGPDASWTGREVGPDVSAGKQRKRGPASLFPPRVVCAVGDADAAIEELSANFCRTGAGGRSAEQAGSASASDVLSTSAPPAAPHLTHRGAVVSQKNGTTSPHGCPTPHGRVNPMNHHILLVAAAPPPPPEPAQAHRPPRVARTSPASLRAWREMSSTHSTADPSGHCRLNRILLA